jgi:hypothetical protein
MAKEDTVEKNTLPQPTDWSQAETVLSKWFRRAREAQTAHYEAAETKRKHHLIMGVVALSLSALTSASALTALLEKTGGFGKGATLVLSIASSIAIALQTFLKLEERANAHKTAAAGYGNVRRNIEKIAAVPPSVRGDIKATIDPIAADMD